MTYNACMDPSSGVPWKKDYTTSPDEVQKRLVFQGIPVQIERPKGFKKTWTYANSTKKPTSVVYKHDYGAIPGTKDYDGEELDVFMGPNQKSKKVFVVSKGQTHNKDLFDEHKVLLGFSSMPQAHRAMQRYLSETMQGIREMDIKDFKAEIDKHGLIKRAYEAGQREALASFAPPPQKPPPGAKKSPPLTKLPGWAGIKNLGGKQAVFNPAVTEKERGAALAEQGARKARQVNARAPVPISATS